MEEPNTQFGSTASLIPPEMSDFRVEAQYCIHIENYMYITEGFSQGGYVRIKRYDGGLYSAFYVFFGNLPCFRDPMGREGAL